MHSLDLKDYVQDWCSTNSFIFFFSYIKLFKTKYVLLWRLKCLPIEATNLECCLPPAPKSCTATTPSSTLALQFVPCNETLWMTGLTGYWCFQKGEKKKLKKEKKN